MQMKPRSSTWNPPGWPWELEIIILLLTLIALFAPIYSNHDEDAADAIPSAGTTAMEAGRSQLGTQVGFLGAVAIVGFYILHLFLASVGINRLTVSPVHFISPLVFALIAYYMLARQSGAENRLSAITWPPDQVAVLALVMLVVTLGCMIARRNNYMRRFAGTSWIRDDRAIYSPDYLRLLFRWRPLLYPPRSYKICPEGILIEGLHYAMTVSFDDVQSMNTVHGSTMLGAGEYYAGTCRVMIRISLHDARDPLWISPEKPEEFVHACMPFLTRSNVSGDTAHKRNHAQHAAPPAAG